MNFNHFPVLAQEVKQTILCKLLPKLHDFNQLENFEFNKVVFVDCTLGLGGHSSIIINHLPLDINIYLVDKDIESIEIAKNNIKRIQDFEKRKIQFINDSFSSFLEKIINDYKFFIVLADLGISYYQIKCQEGFSFDKDSFLDMRYDKKQDLTAYFVLNNYSKEKLLEIFLPVLNNFNVAKRVVKGILLYRQKKRIQTTYDLNKSISKVISAKFLKDILQKVYLSLRIYVNEELKDLEKMLNLFKNLPKNYLLLIITYHSLEGKIVKKFIKLSNRDVNLKKIKPSKEEISVNKPSRSAILWVIDKFYEV